MKLNLDTIGFLRELNRLERCFNETVTGGKISPESVTELHHRAVAVFASTGFAASFGWAVWWNDPKLIAYCRRLLHHVADTVRDRGLGAWLLNTVEAAAISVAANMPCGWMPPMSVRDGHPDTWMLQNPQSPQKRYVIHHIHELMELSDAQNINENQRADMRQYGIDTFRLAAHSMLTWGSADPRCIKIATLLLCQTGLGVEKLQQTESAVTNPDSSRYDYMERLEEYYRQLQLDGDLDYAGALYEDQAMRQASTVVCADPPDVPDMQAHAMAVRYIYDAQRLILAYELLWDRDDIPSVADALTEFEEHNTLPDSGIWENPLFLEQTAATVFGNAFGIVDAFERRDREEFTQYCDMLQGYCDLIRTGGIGILPRILLHAQVRMTLEDDEHTPFSVEQIGAMHALIDDMAYIVLARVPDPDQAAYIARALLEADGNDPTEPLTQLCFAECDSSLGSTGS